jgi:hypothetical protein
LRPIFILPSVVGLSLEGGGEDFGNPGLFLWPFHCRHMKLLGNNPESKKTNVNWICLDFGEVAS